MWAHGYICWLAGVMCLAHGWCCSSTKFKRVVKLGSRNFHWEDSCESRISHWGALACCGGTNLWCRCFLVEMCMKMKELGPPGSPLEDANPQHCCFIVKIHVQKKQFAPIGSTTSTAWSLPLDINGWMRTYSYYNENSCLLRFHSLSVVHVMF